MQMRSVGSYNANAEEEVGLCDWGEHQEVAMWGRSGAVGPAPQLGEVVVDGRGEVHGRVRDWSPR